MYYLRDERSGQYVSSIVKLRGADAYAVYFKDEPSMARWATEQGARDALGRLLDCEYTNPPGVAVHLAVVDPDNEEEVAPMNEITTAQASVPARSLLEIEADILAQKRTIGRSVVIIGHDLIEAKGKLDHGLWGTWLAERVNFSQSTAENYMKIAEQVDSDSTLLNLPYTKVLALLSVPAEEREEFAADNHVEDKSVSEIKKLIRERDEAIREAKAIRSTLSASNAKSSFNEKRLCEAEAQLAEQKKRNSDLVRSLNKTLEEKQALLSREPDTVTIEKEVPPADYEAIKNQLRDTRELLEEAEDELAQAQVERDKAMEELEAMKLDGTDPLDVTPFRDACSTMLNKLVAAPVAGDFFRTKTDFELEQYSNIIALVMEWSVKAQDVIENIRNERSGFDGPFEIAL